jgi:hypothetical protein
MTGPLDEALHRAANAVERHQVPEAVIARAAESLTEMAVRRRRESEVEALVDAILDIAECGDVDDMATSIRNAVAVAAGVIRAETDLELDRIYNQPE